METYCVNGKKKTKQNRLMVLSNCTVRERKNRRLLKTKHFIKQLF